MTHHPPRLNSLALGLLAALLAAGLLAGGCQKSDALEETNDSALEDAAEDALEPEKELVPVEVVTLGRGPIESVLRHSTHLEAERAVEIYAQAGRQIVELRVEEGDRVEKGELLLRLEDDAQRSALAKVESQLRKARREFERQKNLFAKELISEQAMNDATYETEQLEIAREDALRDISYAEVRAPFAGVVTARYVDLGDTVTVNQHLFDLVDFDSIVALIYIPEREMARLEIGQPARLFATSLDGQRFDGEVLRIAPTVDPKSGTVKVTVDAPPAPSLLPGMYVETELVTDTRDDALLLPKRAVIYDQSRAFVFRLAADMTVERLVLEERLADEVWIEPLPSTGLGVGDRIIVAGQAGLKDGAKVRLAGQKLADETTEETPAETTEVTEETEE